MEYQNVPDSVKFSHLSKSSTMLFGLSNKLIKNHPVVLFSINKNVGQAQTKEDVQLI
jgi:hypothetical protein